MKRILQGVALLLLLSLGTATAMAAAKDDFRKGQEAFRQGDYAQALKWFEKARREGMQNAVIHYNIGVTHYRLGNYAQAEKAFLQTARYPKLAPLAWYNLGLVKLRQGDKAAARQWFRKTVEGTDDRKLQTLARRQLAKLEPAKRWHSFAYAGLGYDDNITLTSDVITVPTGKSDGFMELYASTRGLLGGTLKDGILLRAGAFGDFYASLSDYNFLEFNAGLYKTLPLGGWRTESGVRLSRSSYGDTGYLQTLGLILRAKRKLSKTTRVQVRFRLRNLDAIDNTYDYLSGSSYDLRLAGRWRTGGNSSLNAYYQFQDNDRNDLRTTTSFRSVSPQRHRFRVTWRNRLTRNWKMRLAGEYRLSLYPEDNVYNSGAVRIRREDTRWRGLAEVSRVLGKQTELALSYVYTDNTSNLDDPLLSDYNYTRNMFLASVQHSF